ncbi:MAG: DUF4097 family beta strand repeat protein [Candidatus Latescibacterota bacterium]|nr:MAG: DUF4097 family beta strand repeat protein [Candidatus Latescibacterota bacterium]
MATLRMIQPAKRWLRGTLLGSLLLLPTPVRAMREYVFELDEVARERPTLLTIQVPHGSVRLSRSSDNRIHLQGTKVVEAASPDRATRLAEATRLRWQQERGFTSVVAEFPETRPPGFWERVRGEREHVAVDLELRVPAGVPLRVHTESAAVRGAGLSAPIRIESTSGRIDLHDLTSSLNLEVVHCAVDVQDVAGDVRVEGADATVTLRRIGGHCVVELDGGEVVAADLGRDAEVETTSGDVHLSGVRGNLTLVTVAGDAILKGLGGDVRTRNDSGDVDLELEPRLGRHYDVTSRRGDVNLRLLGLAPFQLEAAAPDGDLLGSIPGMAYEFHRPHELRGRVGDSGGPHIHVHSDEGNVHVCCPAREAQHTCPERPRS